jgi:hypothetical protein
MEDLTTQEMEATRGGFVRGSFNHNNVTFGNTATSVNAAVILGSANRSGGVDVAQEAVSSAGNIIA